VISPSVDILSSRVQSITDDVSAIVPTVDTSFSVNLSTDSVLATSPSLDVFSAPVQDTTGKTPMTAPVEIANSLGNLSSDTHAIASGVQVVSHSADVFSSSAYGLISSCGDVTVNSLQADPNPVSDTMNITASVTGPVVCKVLHGRCPHRDVHGPVAPPDPPWPTTTSHSGTTTRSRGVNSASPPGVTGTRVPLSS
jgi:hypothetical protein